ncbi:MAG: PAS domain S-box protein [Burkholderiales bacterium]|nr:PAS domain S-box protein [Burkholderiales bacterium]
MTPARRAGSIRGTVIAMAAVLTLPLAAVYAWQAYRHFAHEREFAEARALSLAQAVAMDAAQVVERSRELIKLLGAREQVRAFDATSCDRVLLAGLHELFAQYATVAAFSADGRLVCSSRDRARGQDIRIGHTSWFQAAMRGREMSVSKPFPGILTGRPVVAFAQSVRDGGGDALGAVVLPFDLLAYRPLAVGMAQLEGTVLGIIDRDGVQVWRSDDAAAWIGREVGAREVMQRLLAAGAGLVEGEGLDGQARLYAASPVRGTDWIAYAGMPRAAAYASTYRDARIAAAAGAAGLGLALILGLRLGRRISAPIRALAAAAQASASGRARLRLQPEGPAELHDAASQFNALLDAREQAEEALRRERERFQDLAELASDWFWEQDAELRFTWVSGKDQGKGWLGLDHILGRRRWELEIAGIDEAGWRAHREQLARREAFAGLVYQVVLPSGEVRWSEVSGRPVHAHDGTFTGYRGTGRDITVARRAEAAREAERAQYRAMVELTADWYWRQDASYRFTYREGLVLAQMGLPPEADYGKARWEMGFLNMREEDWDAHRRLLDRREEFRDLLLQRRSPDGRVFWATVSGRPQFDPDGRFVGYHGIGRDVSAQVRAQQALRDREQQLRLIVDNVPAMIAYMDADGICRFSNERYAAFHGLTPHTIVGRRETDLMSPEGRRAGAEPYQRSRAGETVRYSTSIDYPGRGRVAFDIRRVPHMDAAGVYLGSFVLLNDITELVRAYDGLKESEARFRAIFEACPVPFSLGRESDGLRIDVNPAWVATMGYAREEAVGRGLAEINTYVDPADRGRLRAALDADGRADGIEFLARRKDGRVLTARSWVRRLSIGGETCVLMMSMDVTREVEDAQRIRELNESLERRVRERTAELEAANRELDAFAHSVSHDLRTPLRGIDGYSNLLLEEHAARLDAEGRAHLERIRRGIQRMGNLIDDLLGLARVTRVPMRREPVDVSALAADVAAELRANDPARAVQWRIDPGIVVDADPGLTRVVLENLLGNAWKYTRGTAVPVIEVGRGPVRGRDCQFFVRDNGAGFDMTYSDRLFRPFQRLHSQSQFEGTGVGLATVHRIVVRHGGQVAAHGEPGAGATFMVSFGEGGAGR